MPRVFTAKAGKDYPAHGIKKGETYYHWSFFRGPKQMSKTPPRRSQITGAPTLAAAFACQEALEDALADAKTPEDIVAALQEAVDEADNVMSDFDEKISNLEEAFQNGCPALEEAQEQRNAFESWKDELDSAKSEVESLDASEYESDAQKEEREEEDGDEEVELTFDDLDDAGKDAMMQAARELAEGPDLGL